MQRLHFQVRVGELSCKQILTKISFVNFDIVVKKIVVDPLGCALSVHNILTNCDDACRCR